MLPSNASRPSFQDDQAIYRELMTHLGQFFSEETLVGQLNIEQMFILIDGVLPIEACLYYQVLPLFLDGSRLHLGMVSPQDHTASDYVRRIVSYLHYTLVTRRISSQALQAALSAYLKYSDNSSASSSQADDSAPSPAPNPHRTHPQKIVHNLNTDNQATFVLEKTQAAEFPIPPSDGHSGPFSSVNSQEPAADELTAILEHQETEIIDLESRNNGPRSQTQTQDQDQDNDALIKSIHLGEGTGDTEDKLDPDDPNDLMAQFPMMGADIETVKVDGLETEGLGPKNVDLESSGSDTNIQLPTDGASPSVESHSAETPDSAPNLANTPPSRSGAAPLSVELPANHPDQDISRLKTLPPRDLLRELMARAMGGGIGRLFFERQESYGRILWSQSGVLQSAVEEIPPATFQALINEFKRLTRLPLLPLQRTKQVELERFYNHNRVLLRFRFIPGKYGEQATLQVLRGVALQFYQQQQVARIGQDAVSIAKQLQAKIDELRSRIKAYPRMPIGDQVSLAELKQMLLNLEQQVERLQNEAESSPGSD